MPEGIVGVFPWIPKSIFRILFSNEHWYWTVIISPVWNSIEDAFGKFDFVRFLWNRFSIGQNIACWWLAQNLTVIWLKMDKLYVTYSLEHASFLNKHGLRCTYIFTKHDYEWLWMNACIFESFWIINFIPKHQIYNLFTQMSSFHNLNVYKLMTH